MAVYNIHDYKNNRHAKLRKFKKVLWFFFITYIIIYFLYSYEDYTLQSLQRTLNYISLANDTEQIGDNIDVEIDRTTIYDMFQNGFVTLENDVLTYINAASKIDIEIPYAYQNPDMTVGENQIITFDRQGYEFSASNSFGETFSEQTSSKILDVSISSSDYYAVITDEISYISAITVYDKSNKSIFKWSTSTYNVVCAKIDDSGDTLAAICLHQQDAVVYTTVILFDISKKEIINETVFTDELPIDTTFLNNGNLAIIFRDSICILDSELLPVYKESVSDLKAYNVENGHNILYATDSNVGVDVTVIDSNGNIIAQKPIDLIVKEYAMSNNEIYILTANYIFKYDLELNLLGQVYTESNIMGIIYNNYLYGIFADCVTRMF